jgi:predicted nucleic acid-binding protein
MNWLSVILIIIIATLMVCGTLWYALVQFARFRRRVRRNLAEVENTLHVNVKALRSDTEEFHDVLVKAERKRELTREETAILKKFKKRLQITEKEIEQKLEDATE